MFLYRLTQQSKKVTINTKNATKLIPGGIIMKILFASDTSFNFIENYPGDDKVKKSMLAVSKFFKNADLSIVNLENVMGIREDYIPILKCGPNLISEDRFLNYIKALNPTVVGLSNNHTGDYGEEAIFHTLELLNKSNLPYIGAGKNIADAYRPFIFEKNNIKIGIIAVCENEFGGAKENKAGSSAYNLTRLKNELNNLREQNIKGIVYFHGGNERNPFPSPGKKELYRLFIDLGASAVVAMHTHCPQGYEMYNECPIIYSMGNFFFPKEKSYDSNLLPSWFYGYMVELEFSKDSINLKTIPYTFDINGIRILENEELEGFNNYLKYLCDVIKDDDKLSAFFNAWCIKACRAGISSLQFSESMIKEKNRNVAIARNKFTCEAHNELWKTYYSLCYEERHNDFDDLIKEIEILQTMKLN